MLTCIRTLQKIFFSYLQNKDVKIYCTYNIVTKSDKNNTPVPNNSKK